MVPEEIVVWYSYVEQRSKARSTCSVAQERDRFFVHFVECLNQGSRLERSDPIFDREKITEIVSGARSSKSICVLHDKGKHFVNSLPTCHINLHSLLLTRHKLTDFSSASHRRQLHYSARAAVSRAPGFTFWRDISSVALIIFCQPESYAKVSFSPSPARRLGSCCERETIQPTGQDII